MNILGIDCSTKWTNVGVAIDGRIAGGINMLIGRRQSSLLPNLITQILLDSGICIESIDAVSVTSGPGYFTGIRVGLSYGCALAEGMGIKVVIVNSLTALAAPFLNGKRKVIPVIRARNGFVYFSVVGGSIANIVCVEPPGLFQVRIYFFILSFIIYTISIFFITISSNYVTTSIKFSFIIKRVTFISIFSYYITFFITSIFFIIKWITFR